VLASLLSVALYKTGGFIKSVKSGVAVAIGITAFVLVSDLIGNVVTGTDSGSVLIQIILRLALATAIILGVFIGLGKAG